jgi:hypothetical protein
MYIQFIPFGSFFNIPDGKVKKTNKKNKKTKQYNQKERIKGKEK